jgi:hypothetical protein
MTRDEALETAVHVYGGLVWCRACNTYPLDHYLAATPGSEYDDLEFGRWLLAQGWRFDWTESEQPSAGDGSGALPFPPWINACATNTGSWTFDFVCPSCIA